MPWRVRPDGALVVDGHPTSRSVLCGMLRDLGLKVAMPHRTFATVDHIVPESRGGGWTWMNLVTACGGCNGRKADRTPDEAGMPLVYLPYVPSRFEDFLLEGRHIRADVHEWLAARLPKGSRLN